MASEIMIGKHKIPDMVFHRIQDDARKKAELEFADWLDYFKNKYHIIGWDMSDVDNNKIIKVLDEKIKELRK